MASVLTKKEGIKFDIPANTPTTPMATAKPSKQSLSNVTNCYRCKHVLRKALALGGSESTFWKECPNCGALYNTFRPLEHQAEFLSHNARYKMSAGGYGSGKTTVDVEDVIKHVLLIKNARVCVAARTYPALEATFLKDFYATFPDKLIVRKNEQKHEYRLSNGSEIIFRSFDDPTKLKSLNLTMAVIVEASDVPYDGFTMLQTRIRNTAALIPFKNPDGSPMTYFDKQTNVWKIKYRVDARHINLETNPSSNWVKTKFLCESATIRYLGTAKNENYQMAKDLDPDKYSQIVSTDANPYLPENYVEELCRGKSDAWIAQYIKGSFNFNHNLVFPNVGLRITKPHPLPREFNEIGERVLYYVIGFDYGIVDYSHAIFGAISLEARKLYIYDEMRINNSDVKTIVKAYRKQIKLNGTHLGGLLMLPLFDGRSYNKRESDLHTIGGAFEAEGLYFDPSFTSHEVRIVKLNSLINNNQIEIFSTCEFVIEELLNYTFITDKEGNPTKIPKDGNDHGVTALEFIVAELPHNLYEVNVRTYIPVGERIVHDTSKDVDEFHERNIITRPARYSPFETEEVKYGPNDVVNNRMFCISNYTGADDDSADGSDKESSSILRAPELRCFIPNSKY